MSNVVSKEFQSQLRANARSRVVLLIALSALVPACGIMLALIPSFVQAPDVVQHVATSTPIGDTKAATEQLKSSQAVLTLLAQTAQQKTPVNEALRTVVGARPDGIRIASITYGASTKAGKGLITLSGTTNSRSAIAAFRVALIKTGAFESVSLPVGVLVDSNATTFDLALTGNF